MSGFEPFRITKGRALHNRITGNRNPVTRVEKRSATILPTKGADRRKPGSIKRDPQGCHFRRAEKIRKPAAAQAAYTPSKRPRRDGLQSSAMNTAKMIVVCKALPAKSSFRIFGQSANSTPSSAVFLSFRSSPIAAAKVWSRLTNAWLTATLGVAKFIATLRITFVAAAGVVMGWLTATEEFVPNGEP